MSENRYLITKARRQAKTLGHQLTNFRPWTDSAGFWQGVAACLACGLLIQVNDPPKTITGGASKKTCSKKRVVVAG